ncbi:hypothetical protein FNW02_30775 [Komarekiella sp. 'clone 1']|uniref:Uncharacterized protein n=1 Tax=Komarekiella delphini-convector SJRDD-AB1 TaxID=2593771 RepID=A0AA40T3Q2_9NOST|nr:hypothetical protein [Komarekiella delphini-convector]MBD6620064.1 hypothetical protein [Komarekiella delphini-convector SJRDD-AB1]
MMDNSSAYLASPEEESKGGRGRREAGVEEELFYNNFLSPNSSPASPASPASSLSPEVIEFIDTVNQGRGFAEITQIISEEVQRQIETQLMEFQAAIADSNLAAIDAMSEELQRIKSESATLSGVMERLTAAVAPDLTATEDEVVSFQQAINNLERYGSIIPSQSDILAAQLRMRNGRAWSLVWQSLAKMLIKKLEKKFCKQPTSTEPTGATKTILE